MAAKAAISEETASAGKVQLPVAMLLAVVMLGVALGMGAVGGGLYFLMKSGKLPIGAAAGAGGTSAAGATGAAGEGTVHQVVLEPILVNLADAGGHAYLRLGLTLNVEDGSAKSEAEAGVKSGKGLSEQDLAARDTVLAVLGQQTSAWLLGPDGKEHLKIELKEALAKQNPQLKVKDVFFTDFLVQI